MGDLRRWTVTYTKHIKQKRKVYQDGLIEFHSSINKIMLYDECEKLLDSRVLKKDEVVGSGETLAFDAYLVDIGDLGDIKPVTNLKMEVKDKKPIEMTGTLHGQKTKNNPTSCGGRAAKSGPSASEDIIRDYKKNEMRNYGSLQSHPTTTKMALTGSKFGGLQSHDASQNFSDAAQTTTKEWSVLYTTQIIQKAKKYQDGILRLLLCGSRGRQFWFWELSVEGNFEGKRETCIQFWAILLKEDGTTLTSKHLKLSDEVRTGSTFELTNYLVEVGEPRKFLEEELLECAGQSNISAFSKKSSSFDSSSCSLDTNKLSGNLSINKHLHNGQPKTCAFPKKSSSFNSSSCSLDGNKLSGKLSISKHLRDVHQILSILKKPMDTDTGLPILLTKALGEQSHSSQSSNSVQFGLQDQLLVQHVQEAKYSKRNAADDHEVNSNVPSQETAPDNNVKLQTKNSTSPGVSLRYTKKSMKTPVSSVLEPQGPDVVIMELLPEDAQHPCTSVPRDDPNGTMQNGESHNFTFSEASGGNVGEFPKNNINSNQLGADNRMMDAQRCDEATTLDSSELSSHASRDIKRESFEKPKNIPKEGAVLDDIPSFDLGF